MNWQIIVGIILLIGGLGSITQDFATFVFGLIVGCGLLFWGLKKRGYFRKKVTHQYQIDGCVLAYSYDDVKFYPPTELVSKISKIKLQIGVELQLVQEPENTYDHAAVALYLKGQKVGYLLRNRLQEMANEFMSKGWPVKASLVSLKMINGEYQGVIALSFFRPGEN